MTLSIAVQLVGGHAHYANIRDSPSNGRLHTAHTPDSVQRVNNMVLEDRRMTVKGMEASLWPLNSGSDVLVQSFTALAYRP
jgi:hypothetical protein